MSDDPLHWLKLRLSNWGAWARSAREHLGVVEPPAFADYRSSMAWESEWGSPPPADQTRRIVDERDAQDLDQAMLVLRLLQEQEFKLLRLAYEGECTFPREKLDRAVRALMDII